MRTLPRLALLAALAAPGLAAAQSKLAYVDFQRAVLEVDEGKAAKAQLKKEADEKQKQLDVKSDEIKKLQADFDKQAMVMSAEAKAQKGADLDRRKMEVQEFFMKLQQDLSTRERDAMRGIFEKMQNVVREIADADGIAMVVDRSALVYAQPALDVTNEVIRKYNARFPAGNGGAKKADAGAKKADAPAAKK
jgi:outer membrane protein